jgi:hypothetical protein
MLMGLQKGKSAQLRRIVSGREIHYSFYVWLKKYEAGRH